MNRVRFYSSAYGSYSLGIVGEESYQDEIKCVFGYEEDNKSKLREDGFTAELILEDNNPHDRGNAVRVDIDNRTVGYLSRSHAKAYRQSLAKQGLKNVTGTCYAAIFGKHNNNIDDMLFGVWLDLDVERLVVLSRSDKEKKPVKQPKSASTSKSSNQLIFIIFIVAFLIMGVVGVVIDEVSLVLENSGRLPTRTPTLAPTPNMLEAYRLTLTAVKSLTSTPTP